MLHIENITKRYGDKAAVDHLTLSIAPGEICGFIGHNGAGKTTTLKAVAKPRRSRSAAASCSRTRGACS